LTALLATDIANPVESSSHLSILCLGLDNVENSIEEVSLTVLTIKAL
jgi:hypothetical protein